MHQSLSQHTNHQGSSVVLVDDHQLVRDALAYLIRMTMNVRSVIGLASIKELQTYVGLQAQSIDYLFLDLELPDAQGTDGLRTALKLLPKVPIYVYTGSMDTQLKHQCVQIGARAVIDKATITPDLSDRLKRIFAETINPVDKPISALDTLSPRQHQVLELIHEGLSNQEIAEQLKIAVPTVKAHKSAIFKAIGVNSQAQAIKIRNSNL